MDLTSSLQVHHPVYPPKVSGIPPRCHRHHQVVPFGSKQPSQSLLRTHGSRTASKRSSKAARLRSAALPAGLVGRSDSGCSGAALNDLEELANVALANDCCHVESFVMLLRTAMSACFPCWLVDVSSSNHQLKYKFICVHHQVAKESRYTCIYIEWKHRTIRCAACKSKGRPCAPTDSTVSDLLPIYDRR